MGIRDNIMSHLYDVKDAVPHANGIKDAIMPQVSHAGAYLNKDLFALSQNLMPISAEAAAFALLAYTVLERRKINRYLGELMHEEGATPQNDLGARSEAFYTARP